MWFPCRPFRRVKSSEFFGELLRITRKYVNVIVSCLIYISSVTKRGKQWRHQTEKQKKGKTPSPTTQTRIKSFSFTKGVDCRSFLRLVLWTSSLFSEGKAMCIKTNLKCDFLVDPFVVWNQANFSGNCCELQVSRSSFNKVGITCFVAN